MAGEIRLVQTLHHDNNHDATCNSTSRDGVIEPVVRLRPFLLTVCLYRGGWIVNDEEIWVLALPDATDGRRNAPTPLVGVVARLGVLIVN